MEFNLPTRKQDSHKGTFGKVLNIAGSKYMPGAAYLSSVAALKVGCGYCYLVSDTNTINSVSSQTQNVVFVPLKNIKKLIKQADVLSIGCGLSTSFIAGCIFFVAMRNAHNLSTIIDADGLNIISKFKKINLPKKLIMTPHPMEAARLLGVSVDEVLENPVEAAKTVSTKYNCVTVLKLHKTIVCSNELEIHINETGNSSLAKAGSGDVLTGMMAGLLAQGMSEFESAKLAVYLHGRCGELASKDLSEYSVMANDLINYIPIAIKELQ